MDRSHSYADLVTGTVFLQLADSEALVEAAQDPDMAYREELVRYAWENHRGLFAHEWAHVLQVASYPYLYLRAARQGRMMAGIGVYLTKNQGRYPFPLPFELTWDWQLANALSETPVRIVIDPADRNVSFEAVANGSRVVRNALTELDLIEEDAQIFQYRVEIGSRGNGKAYRRWLIEQPRYSRAFNFLSRVFDDEIAYRMLPVLCRAAFRTTRPLWTFGLGVGILSHNGAGHLSDWVLHELITDLVLVQAGEQYGRADLAKLTIARPETADEPGVIPPEGLESFHRNNPQVLVAPLTGLHLRDGTVTRCLSEPWSYFDRRGVISNEVVSYLPPGIVLQVASPRFPRGSTILWISPLLQGSTVPGMQGTTYAEVFNAALRARLVWKTVLQQTGGPNPNCPHTGCPAHSTGLCHAWFPIPRAAADCEFPVFLRYTTGHTVAPDGSGLVPAT
jgi:hypothetical protein